MKTVIGFLILPLVLVTELSAQCPSYPGTWNRSLANSSYTWAFDRSTIGDAKYTDGTLLSIATVESAIAGAVSAWTNAANFAGQRITITQIDPPTNYGGAAIKVWFNSVPGTACAETNSNLITLDIGRIWKLPGGSTGANLTTIVLHEMGHIFLGGGHYENDPSSIMRPLDCGPQSGDLSSCDRAIVLDFYNPNYTVYVKNDFGGGNVKVDGTTYYDIPTNGKDFTWRESTFPHSVEAIDGQSYGGYVRRYQFWTLPGGLTDGNNPQSVPKPSSSSVTYTANFLKEFNININNSFIGVGNAGIIKVNGQQITLPTSAFPVLQFQSISAEAISGQVYNGVMYTFVQWTDGNTSISRTITPNDHENYTASFTGKPIRTPDVIAGGPVGANVQVTWSNHPRGNAIEYHVWRKVKHQSSGTWSGPVKLAVLSYGTTCYTDYDYVITDGYTNDLLWYDVRAHYLTESSDADPYYVANFGRLDIKLAEQARQESRVSSESETPVAYSLLNYPNPFNPSTIIRFELPQPSLVRLEVFDVRGALLATLVHEQKAAGIYRVQFDAMPFPAGLYFYRLQAGAFTKMQKMALVK